MVTLYIAPTALTACVHACVLLWLHESATVLYQWVNFNQQPDASVNECLYHFFKKNECLYLLDIPGWIIL
jgi:hypothetical protein